MSVAIGQHRATVEHQRVLSADHVEVGDGAAGLLRALRQQVIATCVLVTFERRGVRHQHQLGTGFARLVQRLGKPQVLADDQADRHAIDLEHAGSAVGVDIKIATLVEHRVVGQLALAVGGDDLAVAQHAGRVVQHGAGRFRPANHRGDALHRRRDLTQRRFAVGQEHGPEQQVLRRIAADGQLRKQDQVRAMFIAGRCDHRGDTFGIRAHRAHRKVELGQGDSEGL